MSYGAFSFLVLPSISTQRESSRRSAHP